MRTLGIIPARGGSKRLRNKNMMGFNGVPLVATRLPLTNALDHTIISMDSAVDIYTLENYIMSFPKAEIIKRPLELAQDDTPTEDVILHHLKDPKYADFDTIVLLQPTSPLFTAEHLEHLLGMFSHGTLKAIATIDHHGKFNGSCIIIDRKEFEKHKTLWIPSMNVYVLEESCDIDDLSDFRIAEAMEKQLKKARED